MNLSYSVDEVCKITGLGRTKIYEAMKNGLLPAKKFGKRTIILKVDLDDFLKGLKSYKQPTQHKSKIKKPKKSEN